MGITRRQALKLAAAAFLCASLPVAGACSQKSTHGGIFSEDFRSRYDWHNLVRDGEKMAYIQDGVVNSKWGIDVSEHQHSIDWSSVAASGVEFAFIRIGNRGATAGALNTDEYFLANALGSTSNGIPASAYFFSQALTTDEAVEEAHFALQQLRSAEMQGAKFKALAYDHEHVNVEGARANDVSGEQLSQNAVAFCEAVASAGYEPMIYGNQRDLKRLDETVLTTYPIWYAEYDVEVPTVHMDFEIWQYSNAGNIPGISTRVDLNLWLDQEEPNSDNSVS